MDSTEEIYSMLELPVIPNFEGFECSICCQFCQPNDGVILHECNHSFCRYLFILSCNKLLKNLNWFKKMLVYSFSGIAL